MLAAGFVHSAVDGRDSRDVGDGTEGWGGWTRSHAVLSIVVDPEDFAAAGCNAEVGREIGKWNGEVARKRCGAGRRGSGAGGLGLEPNPDNVEGSDY